MAFSQPERFEVSGAEVTVTVDVSAVVAVGTLIVGMTKNVAVGIVVKVGLAVGFGTSVGVFAALIDDGVKNVGSEVGGMTIGRGRFNS